jgi:hypothetical protein
VDYENLKSKLVLKFDSDNLDILQVGILNYHLHGLLNQVAIALLGEEDTHRVARGEPKLLQIIPQTTNRDDALIRARITGVRQGSIELDLQTVILAVYSTPGAIAILQNLAANVIWAVGAYAYRVSGAKVTKHRSSLADDHNVQSVAARKRLGTKAEKFVKLLAESTNGGRIYLKSDDEELEIIFNGPNDYEDEKPSRTRR